MKTTNIINIQNLCKSFAEHEALKSIDLDIRNGEFLTLLGPSGCGKTTLLRILAGFETADSGSIHLNGKNLVSIPAEKRHINMVFQSYALFPHMNVYENIAFGLRCKKLPAAEIKTRAHDALTRVNLQNFAKRKPDSLSGGQQQRVAIARAIVNEPQVLLLDEPLSALDYNLRKLMRLELKELQQRLGITFIFVTHDQEEALTMSDRIAVMNAGKIEQIGTSRDIYEEPSNLFTAKFIGEANIFETVVEEIIDDQILVHIEGQKFKLKNTDNFTKNQKIAVIIRPEDISVWDQFEINGKTSLLPGVVEQVIYKGSTVDLMLRLESGKKIAASAFFDEDDENLDYHNRDKIWMQWNLGWEVILADGE